MIWNTCIVEVSCFNVNEYASLAVRMLTIPSNTDIFSSQGANTDICLGKSPDFTAGTTKTFGAHSTRVTEAPGFSAIVTKTSEVHSTNISN